MCHHMLLHHYVQTFLSLINISGFQPEPVKMKSKAFPTGSSKNFQRLSIKIDVITSSTNLQKLFMLFNWCLLYRFLLFHPSFRLIKSKTRVFFSSSSLKLEYFSTSSAGVIPPSRSWITCALNFAGQERRFFFKWR